MDTLFHGKFHSSLLWNAKVYVGPACVCALSHNSRIPNASAGVIYARRGIYLKVTYTSIFFPPTPFEQHADCLAGEYVCCVCRSVRRRVRTFLSLAVLCAPIIRGPMRDNGPFSCQQRGSMSLPIRFYDVFGCMHARPLGCGRTRAANYGHFSLTFYITRSCIE
jgi:hypothetical protein